MNSKSNDSENNSFNREVIGFWDFINQDGDLIENFEKHTNDYSKSSPFPKTLIEDQHFNFYSEKLGQRIKLFENSPCYGYLDKFLDYFKQAYQADNYELYNQKFYFANASLQLFTFCHEKHIKNEQDKRLDFNEITKSSL